MAKQKCAICSSEATKKVIWADGRAYQPSCDEHVKAVQDKLTRKNGDMTELAGVQDLSDVIDLVSSRVYPDLERKPGGPDNWVEAAGGLPSYIERIAKHLHYERGFSISRAIATAVNTVKRWARGGHVTKYGTVKRVTPKTQALAAKAVASWEAKKRAGDLAMSDDLIAAIDLTHVSESVACDLLDLADADIDDTSTMVALIPPKAVASKIAVAGGVPVEDLHVTVTFHGNLDDEKFNALVEDLKAWAADIPIETNLKGTIGGLGTFPATDAEQGQPWWVPVDVPGLNTLHEQVRAVADRSAPASEDHGYTPHMTLTYIKDGEAPPSMVDAIPVSFTSLWVVRGNTQREEIPLKDGDGADLTERAILSANIDLSKDAVELSVLAERANRVVDPAKRDAARRKVLELAGVDANSLVDLASTIPPRNAKGRASDGRRSYDNQGKWAHGFVPLNRAAKEAKAKGSPIAIKRLNRIFGKSPDAPKGRAGNRSAEGGKKSGPKSVKVAEKSHPGAERAKDLGQLRRTPFEDNKEAPRAKLPASQKEASKDPRVPERASQNWDEIPDSLKTVRNGKRYVLAEFGGRQYVTEWVGGVRETESSALKDRKVMRTLSAKDAADMSEEELQALVNNPRTPEAVRKVAKQALKKPKEDK